MKDDKWYSDNIEKIKNNLNDIISKSEAMNYNLVKPDRKIKESIRKIIFDFIRKNKRLIYGGTAIDFWLRKKKENLSIYKDFPGDIEFYSPEPMKDTYLLCNELYESGYINILGREAMHKNTFSIFVEHTDFCDITLMNETVIKNNVPYIESGGLRYVKPDFLLTDIFRVFSNPLHDYSFRLKKVFDRFIKLKKYYFNPPLKPQECKTRGVEKRIREMRKYVFNNFIFNNSDIILCGAEAYKIYLEESNYLKKNKSAYSPKENFDLVIITDDLRKTTEEVYNLLIENYKKEDIKLEEFYKFFQFYDKKISFKFKDRVLIDIYGYNEICTQYHKIEYEDGFLQIVSFDYLMMYLNSMLFRKLPVLKSKNHYRCMIYYLFLMQNYYLKKNNLIGIEEDGLFSQFLLDCKWITLSEIYKKKQETNMKVKKNIRPIVFEYRPETKLIENPPFVKYPNESGNQIIQEDKRMVKL